MIREISINGSNCGFRLKDQDLNVLADAIQSSNMNVESLSLTNHQITENGLKYLAILTAKTITNLDLQGNDITRIGPLNLDSPSLCKLKMLNIGHNPLGEVGGLELGNALSKNIDLITLKAHNCSFTLIGLVGVITSLHDNSTLENLYIDRPLLSIAKEEESASHISRVLLNTFCSLNHLSLRLHSIGDTGARILSDALSRNYSLESISLESNRIGVAGAEALASYLILQQRQKEASPRANRNYLRCLQLSYNIIGDEGAIAIAEAIRCNSMLEEVTLKSNAIGSDGLVALGEALESSKSMKCMKIFGNDFEQIAGKLFFDLGRHRFPFMGIRTDFEIYIVDRVYMVAEK